MSDEKFEVFKKPSPETRIWRYMDFASFVSLLTNSALYFKRMDLFEDDFEGSIPKNSYPKTPSSELKEFFKASRLDPKKEIKKLREAQHPIDQMHSKLVKAERKMTFINSWSINESESMAMWRLYLKGSDGVALQSTLKRLTDSFVNKDDVNLGLVHYVDYNQTDRFYFEHISTPCMFKRKCFEYEKELRALIITKPTTEKAKKQYWWKSGIKGMPDGLDKKVDVAILVEEIRVSPNAGTWFIKLVDSVVKKYEYSLEVKPSSVADKPTF